MPTRETRRCAMKEIPTADVSREGGQKCQGYPENNKAADLNASRLQTNDSFDYPTE